MPLLFLILLLFNWLPSQGSNLFMGNIGDSRAILGSKDNNDSMVAIQLTVDLKPDLPSMTSSTTDILTVFFFLLCSFGATSVC